MNAFVLKIFGVAVLVVLSMSSNAQNDVPNAMSFQAVARTLQGLELTNTEIGVKFSIWEGGFGGTLVYREEHFPIMTNAYGLFTAQIGNGVYEDGIVDSFSAVPWVNEDLWLVVEFNDGDGIYDFMSETELLTVPYAYLAENVVNNNDADADPDNEAITDLDLTPELDLIITEGGEEHVINLTAIGQDDDWTQEDDVLYNLDADIGIGTDNPITTINIQGSQSVKVETILDQDTYFVAPDDYVVILETNSQNIQVTLPSAITFPGRVLIFKQTDDTPGNGTNDYTVTLLPQAGQLVEGASSYQLGWLLITGVGVELVSDGSNWWVIN